MYGLTLTLKNEIVKIAPKGRVNCVAPGYVRTPMVQNVIDNREIMYQALATYSLSPTSRISLSITVCFSSVPLKRVALPLDIAPQIVFLSSEAMSGHITGQLVMVDGGMEGLLQNMPEEILEH